MGRLADAIAALPARQIAAGAQAVQLFDSWVGCLSPDDYRATCCRTCARLIAALARRRARHPLRHRHRRAPADADARGGRRRDRPRLARRPRRGAGRARPRRRACRATSTRWRCSRRRPRSAARAAAILDRAGGRPGHIFNLGHGILPRHAGRPRARAGRHRARAVERARMTRAHRRRPPHRLRRARAPEDVRPFLASVTRGPAGPAERFEEVVHHYELIGGRSPLNELTRRQAAALARGARAASGGRRCRSTSACATGIRSSPTRWRRWRRDGVRRALGLILARAPDRGHVGALHRRRAPARAPSRAPARPRWTFAPAWLDHPRFIEAVAERVRAALAERARERAAARRRWSSPRTASRRRWPTRRPTWRSFTGAARARRRAARPRAVAARLPEPQRQPARSLARARRQRRARGRWRRDGARDVVVAPIGFVCDHVEVLYDLDVEARRRRRGRAACALHRAPARQRPSGVHRACSPTWCAHAGEAGPGRVSSSSSAAASPGSPPPTAPSSCARARVGRSS